MKNEKLELLLNKMVTFEKSEKLVSLLFSYKGFLYKGNSGYYIKVVETEIGPLIPGSIINLSEGDEDFIVYAAKPKLMRVSLKSWHYRLIKYILGDNAPTPRTMQNGCPYFWLLVLSMFVLPFKVIVEGVKIILNGFHASITWCLKAIVDGWLTSIDDVMAYELYWRGSYSNTGVKMPKTAKIFFKHSDDDFLSYYINEKYNLNKTLNPTEYKAKREELSAKWDVWMDEIKAKREKESKEYYEAQAKEKERVAAQMARRKASKEAWDARMKPIKDGLAALGASWSKVINAFKFKGDLKLLIKRTKQVVGFLVTIALLAVSFVLVNLLAYALIAFVDFSIENWMVYAVLGALAVLVGIVYVLYIVIGSWLQGVVNKYQRGKKVWYIEPLIYGIWYPIKYAGMLLAYAVFYILWHPIKFIFFTFLWKKVLVPFGLLIGRLFESFVNGLINSTGVFGEYFGASYSDYCPGIEWADTDETEEEQ